MKTKNAQKHNFANNTKQARRVCELLFAVIILFHKA